MSESGYTVELGGQTFTQAQWEAVQTYVGGADWEVITDKVTCEVATRKVIRTAPVPAGPTDAQAELRAAIAQAYPVGDEDPAKNPEAWRFADAVLALPAVRAALDAQETVRRVEALADELLASRYDSGTDHGYGYSDGLAEAADRIHAVAAAAVEGERT